MRRLFFLVSFLFLLLHTIFAAEEESSNSLYRIDGSLKFFQSGVNAASARVFLNQGTFITTPRADGTFAFVDVPAGSYVLEVQMTGYSFDPLRVDVSSREHGKIRAVVLFSSPPERVKYPLALKATPISYFQMREQWSILALLKQPMVLMILVTLVLLLVFPRMVAHMDPEERKALQRQQAQMSFSNILSGKAFEEAGKQPPPPAATKQHSRKQS